MNLFSNSLTDSLLTDLYISSSPSLLLLVYFAVYLIDKVLEQRSSAVELVCWVWRENFLPPVSAWCVMLTSAVSMSVPSGLGKLGEHAELSDYLFWKPRKHDSFSFLSKSCLSHIQYVYRAITRRHFSQCSFQHCILLTLNVKVSCYFQRFIFPSVHAAWYESVQLCSFD